jgi:hemoglobin
MRKTLVKLFSIAALAAVTLTPALAADKDKGKMATKSLYDRLGKKAAITKVVDEFVARCAADKRINAFFAKTAADPARLKKFKANLVDQICQASGGPCKYTGKDMKSAHAGMGISSADFGALVEDLVGALDKFKVGEKEKGELLGALGPMKGDIVEKP